ncbi:Protein kinase domain/Protein tyrosine kinase [Novymonas esmeraldas]|uniref:Protein kinase domain/Protein tyrosine kinase n=1 Tax=Novymonas esmeraldas TaxID=1808958 RepID=A0AAW0F258_9TRYP
MPSAAFSPVTPRGATDRGTADMSHAWPNWDRAFPSNVHLSRVSSESTDSTTSSSGDGWGDCRANPAEGAWSGGKRDACRRSGGPQVKTVAFIAFIMCFGVCLVGLSGFLPSYIIGFHDVSAAVQVSQTQAIASMVASASTSVRRLPNILKFILASQMSICEHETPCASRNATHALFSLANIVSQARYRNFISFITAVHAEEQHHWCAVISSFFTKDYLGGTATSSLEDNRNLYAVDPTTHLIQQPPRVLLREGGTARQYALHRVPALFARDAGADEMTALLDRRLSLPTAVWMPYNYSGWYAYFSALVPVRVVTEGGTYTGFLEAGLRSMYVAHTVQDHFQYAIRHRGCYMMVDVSKDVVIINSWNQSLRHLSRYDSTYVPFSLTDVQHPLMKAAMQHLRQRRGSAAGERGAAGATTEGTQVSFPFGRDTATVRVSACSSAYGQELMFVSVVLQYDFFIAIYRTLRILSFTMLVAVVGTACASYYVAVYLRTAIHQLTVALTATSKLQFTADAAHGVVSHSRITELVAVESAYAHVQQQLMALKTVIPGPLLVAEDDELSDSADMGVERGGGGRTVASASPGRRRSSLTASDGGSAGRDMSKESDSTGGGGGGGGNEREMTETANGPHLTSVSLATAEQPTEWVQRRWQQNVFLNTKVFNERVNQFHKRYCTMVWISRPYTLDANEQLLEDYFRVVYTATGEFRGCLQFLRPDYAVVTFNALTSLPLHAKHACDFALAVQRRIKEENACQISVQVDTNNFLVGTCGSETGRKSRVVFDVAHFLQFSVALRARAFHRVVVTQPTAKHLEFYETIPLEVVTVPHQEAPYTLYELRDASEGNIGQMQRTAERFRTGFQYMRMGDYFNALRAYRQVDKADSTADYFIQLCLKRVQEGSTAPYVSQCKQPPMRIFAQALHCRNCKSFLQFATRCMGLLQKDGLFTPGPTSARSLLDNRGGDTSTRWSANGASAGSGGSGGSKGRGLPLTRGGDDGGLPGSSPLSGARDAGYVSSSAGYAEPSPDDLMEEEEGLIEWIDFQSQSDVEEEEALPVPVMGSPAAGDNIPLCLLDSNGQKWNRARKPEHSSPSSIVYQAIADDGLQVAIKFLPKKNRNIPETRLHNEINIMSTLKHLNVVQYISSTWTEAHIGIIMEFAPGGSLRDTIDSFGVLPESLVRRYMVDILHGLACLHRGGVTHGDVKPHNILLGADGVCKLSDFGSTVSEAADLARSNGMLEFRGTAVYTSPEVASGHQPTAASDIYSLGISFLEMLLGRLPWRWRTHKLRTKRGDCVSLREVAFVQAVGLGEIVPVIPRHLPTAAQEFAQACCRASPAERPTVNDLLSFRFVL